MPLTYDGSSQRGLTTEECCFVKKDITHSPFVLHNHDLNRITYARNKLKNHQLQYLKYQHEPVSRVKLQMAILEDIIGPRRGMVFECNDPHVDKKLLLPKSRKQSLIEDQKAYNESLSKIESNAELREMKKKLT